MAKKKIVIQTKYEVHGAEKVKGAYEGVGNEAQKAGNKVGGVNTQVKKTSGLIKSLKNMSGALGITAGVVVLGSAFRSAFNNVRKFSKANSNLAAVLNTTKGEIKELTAQQKQLGASTEFSASQVANAQIELAKMGFTMKQIGESTAGVLSLASASGAGLSESAEVMSATLKGFGLNASESGRVADTMAASFVNSSLDMNKFRESMKLVAPIARAANIDLGTTTALLGELANNGLAGSIAGTGLKNLMSKLSNENSKLSKELGFSVKNSEDLVRAFHELKKGNIDLTAATELTDERSKAAFLTMINGIDNVEALKVKLGEVGIAAKIAGEKMNNLDGDIQILGSAWEGLTLQGSAAESGIRSVVQGITSVINFLAENFKTVLKVVASVTLGFIGYRLGIVAARLATIAYSASQGIATVATALFRTGLNGAKVAFRGLNSAMAANPFGIIITLLGVLLPFLIDLGDESERAAGKVDKLTEAQKKQAEALASQTELKKRYEVRDKLSQAALSQLKQDLESELKLEEDKRAKSLFNVIDANKDLKTQILSIEKEIAEELEGLEIRKNQSLRKEDEAYVKNYIKGLEKRKAGLEGEVVALDDLNSAVKTRGEQIDEVNRLIAKGNPSREKELGLLEELKAKIKSLKEERSKLKRGEEESIISKTKEISKIQEQVKALTTLTKAKKEDKKESQQEKDTKLSIERVEDIEADAHIRSIKNLRDREDEELQVRKEAALKVINLSKATAEQKIIEVNAIEDYYKQLSVEVVKTRESEDEATEKARQEELISGAQANAEIALGMVNQSLNAELSLKLDANKKEQQALEEKFKNGAISEDEFNKEKQRLSDKAHKIEKDAALSQLAVDTASAISGLITSSMGNPLNGLTGGAAGIAQFGVGMGLITRNAAISAELLKQSAPQIDSAGGSAPSTQQTSPDLGFEGTSAGTERFGAQVIRAYVTESDITTAQETISNIEGLSEIG